MTACGTTIAAATDSLTDLLRRSRSRMHTETQKINAWLEKSEAPLIFLLQLKGLQASSLFVVEPNELYATCALLGVKTPDCAAMIPFPSSYTAHDDLDIAANFIADRVKIERAMQEAKDNMRYVWKGPETPYITTYHTGASMP